MDLTDVGTYTGRYRLNFSEYLSHYDDRNKNAKRIMLVFLVSCVESLVVYFSNNFLALRIVTGLHCLQVYETHALCI